MIRSHITLLRRPVAASFGASFAIQGMNAATGIILARSLGPHGRGELAAILLWPGLLTILVSLGLSDAITFHTARRTAPLRSMVGTVAALCTVQSVLVVGMGLAVVPVVLGHFGPHTVRLGLLFLAYAPFFYITVYVMSILQGLQRFGPYQALRVGQIVVVCCGLLGIAALTRLRLVDAVVVYVSAYVLLAAAATVLASRAIRGRPSFDRRLGRQLLAYALRSHTSNMSSVLNERFDLLLISIFLAPVQLGFYVVAVTLTSVTAVVGQSVSMVALPTLAAHEEGVDRRHAARRYFRSTLIVAIAVSAPLFVVTPFLVRHLFGSEFAPAVTAARILLVAAVVLTTTRMAQAIQKAIGRPLDAGISEFVALGVTFVSLAALLPWLGIVGAATASLLAYSASCAWTLRRLSGELGLGRGGREATPSDATPVIERGALSWRFGR